MGKNNPKIVNKAQVINDILEALQANIPGVVFGTEYLHEARLTDLLDESHISLIHSLPVVSTSPFPPFRKRRVLAEVIFQYSYTDSEKPETIFVKIQGLDFQIHIEQIKTALYSICPKAEIEFRIKGSEVFEVK